jgi:hypothetical protein
MTDKYDGEIKNVNITGGAAAELSGGAKKGRRTTKKRQEGGSPLTGVEVLRGVSPVMANVQGIESRSAIAAVAASPNSNTWLKYPVDAPVPPRIIPEPSYTPSPDRSAAPTGQYAQAGGKTHNDNKHVKVELKKKTTAKKVHLNPKKADAPKTAKKHQTRKHRKVTIGVSSLHKRITRAKKLHKQAKDMPIDKLKDKLVKSGLIKSNSKAPESVLRQIAADAEVVKNKAL